MFLRNPDDLCSHLLQLSIRYSHTLEGASHIAAHTAPMIHNQRVAKKTCSVLGLLCSFHAHQFLTAFDCRLPKLPVCPLTTKHILIPRTSRTPGRDRTTRFLLLNNLICNFNGVHRLSQLFY